MSIKGQTDRAVISTLFGPIFIIMISFKKFEFNKLFYEKTTPNNMAVLKMQAEGVGVVEFFKCNSFTVVHFLSAFL